MSTSNCQLMMNQGVSTDWKKYSGKWYEQARIPSRFEPMTMRNSTAEYTPMTDGSIQVMNKADYKGAFQTVIGKATVDPTKSGTLNVSFANSLFASPYIVLDHNGNEYDMAVVGGTSRQYLWLLTRGPYLTDKQWRRFQTVAIFNGYDLGKVQRTPTGKTGGAAHRSKKSDRLRI